VLQLSKVFLGELVVRRCKKQKLEDGILILGEMGIGQLDNCKAI